MRMRSIVASVVLGVSTVTPALAGTGIFRTPYLEVGSSNATGLAIGDFDQDGTTDVVTVSAGLGGNELTILVGFNDGTLSRLGTTVNLNSVPSGMIQGRFDADDLDDLIVANGTDGSIAFLKGLGNTDYFAPPGPPIEVGQSPVGFASADLNHDDKVDLVVAGEGGDSTPGSVTILLGANNGTFTVVVQPDPAKPGETIQSLPAQLGTRAVALGNIDADPALDIVALNSRADSLSIYSGDGNGVFTPQGTIPTGPAPQDLALVDLDGDGNLDLVIADANANAVEVRLGHGDRTFSAAQTYPVGTAPNRLAIGKLNGDALLDLVVSNTRSSDVSVLLGQPGGTFSSAHTFVADSEPQVIGIGDMNDDGKLDVVAATQGGDNGPSVAVLRNTGDGRLYGVEDVPAANGPSGVAAADVDDDALPDLIVAGDSGQLKIFPARENGFGAPLSLDIGGRALAVLATDLNADGRPDLAAVDNENSRVAVLLATGPGTFAAPVTYSTSPGPVAMTSGDFNGDGRPDLAVTSIGANRTCHGGSNDGNACAGDNDCPGGTCGAPGTTSVLLQQANGSFGPARLTPVEETPLGITALDANCDGKDDLVVANEASNTVSVLRSAGDGTFTTVQTLPAAQVGQGPISLASGDFNRDGVADFAVSDFVTPVGSNSLRIFTGACDGPFAPVSGQGGQLNVGGQVSAIVARDFTGDQKADIAVLNQTSNALRLVIGVGDGRFTPTQQSDGVSRMPVALVAADFNGDGRYDAASANSDSSADNVSVLINCARDQGCDPFLPGPPGSAALRGDGNNDGIRSAADLVAVAAEVMDGDGRQVEDIAMGSFGGERVSPGIDANGDGIVTPQDRTAVARRIFGGA